jgi:1,4-alpha-glucan branching enzyme
MDSFEKKGSRMARESNNGNGERKQSFSFADPSAKNVQLVGTFTQWEERPIKLSKGRDGVWRATVALEPGTHRYRFLVDGQWRDDPKCGCHAPNPFGGEDAVCEVA